MTLDGTRSYLVGRERPAVIDPGPPDAVHQRALLEALDGATPAGILLTHFHPDHAGGAAALAAASGAPVYMARAPGCVAAPAERFIGEGDTVATDAGSLRAIATPGHAPEHLCFAWGDTVFVGDLLMGEGDTTLVAPPEGNLGDYLRSLDRIAALAPRLLFPTHGPPLREPREAIARFRRHREERIAGALHALCAAGPSRPAELLDAVYGDAVPPALRAAAAASLAAVLDYLAETDRARRLPDGSFAAVAE